MYLLDDLNDFKDEIMKSSNQSISKETCAAVKCICVRKWWIFDE
jgi:hypothetical protein